MRLCNFKSQLDQSTTRRKINYRQKKIEAARGAFSSIERRSGIRNDDKDRFPKKNLRKS